MTSSESLRAGYSTRMEIPLRINIECKRALSATKTCSQKQFAPPFTLAPARRRRFRAFTLVEMLVVMIIILIALGALIPAVTSLSKSSGRQAATSNLIGAIEQARAEAIKSGQAAYVVFPTFGSGTSQMILDRYNYRSYAIFEDDPANPGAVKQLTPWRTLPTGVSFRSKNDNPPQRNGGLTPLPTASFTFQPLNTAAQFPFIKFNSEGQVDSPASDVLLVIFEGYVSGGNEVITGAKDTYPTPNPFAAEALNLSHTTGRAEPTATPTPTS